MVLMRRKDKRRGNEAEEIVVASDSSIVANKGLRSLQSARTGRFAADMRVQVGGYGRPDKTWGVDHPWHTTREEIIEDLSSRDHMEEGMLVKQEERPHGQGLSRAALKKKKAKMKKGGLAGSTAGSEMGSEVPSVVAADAKQKTEEKQQQTAAVKKVKAAAKKDAATEETQTNDNATINEEPAEENKSKKRKRVNRNKKKQEKARATADAGDISDDDDSDLDASVEVEAKAKKQKAAAADAQPTQVVASTQKDKKHAQAEVARREATAKQYEAVIGQELTTASGLTVRDVRIGQGRVPSIGEMITVRYRGRIDDKNGIVFGKGMLSITYGTGSVIAGWEEGMGTMRTGGIRHLTVPPSLAYGSVAKGAKIPANSTLFFEVELVRMGKRKRDAVAKDDIPLPSSFQRKKTPTASATKEKNSSAAQKKSKGRRRKFSI